MHGAAWLVDRAGDVSSGAAGGSALDTIFRISSVTKPVVAALAMGLVDDGLLRLDDPVDALLPELADRRVLRDPDGPIEDTVPAERPITVRDVLEFRLGLGMDFAGPFPGTVLGALGERGLPVGPPAPQASPGPTSGCGSSAACRSPTSRVRGGSTTRVRRCSACSSHARRTDPCRTLLAERLLDPLGMTDTGFHVPPDRLGRFGRQWLGPEVYDEPDGQWAHAARVPRRRRRAGVDGRGPARVRGEPARRRPVHARTHAWSHGGTPPTGEGWGLGSGCSMPTCPTAGTPAPTAGTAAWGRRGGPTR